MANRTVRFYGLGLGNSTAEITAEVDGTQVFTGPVPTTTNAADTPEILFTFELPIAFEGTKPVSITVNSGTVKFAQVLANYHAFVRVTPVLKSQRAVLTNPSSTVEERKNVFVTADPTGPAFTDEELAALATTHIDIENIARPDTITGPLQSRYQALLQYNENNFVANCADPLWDEGYGDIQDVHPDVTYPAKQVSESRTNVTIDGVAQNPVRTGNLDLGTWNYTVTAPSVFDFDLVVKAGVSS